MKAFVTLLALTLLFVACEAVLLKTHLKEVGEVYVRHIAGRPKRSVQQNVGDGFTFPNRMSFSFDLRSKKIRLDLKLNRRMLHHARLVSISADGTSTVHQNSKRDYAYYQVTNDRMAAAVRVRCPGYTYPCHIEGSFHYEGEEYEIEPNHNKPKLSTKVPHTLHVLDKTEYGDYGQDTIDVDGDEKVNGYRKETPLTNTVRTNTSGGRLKRQAGYDVHIIELEMVVDSEIFRFFTDFLGLNSENETLDAIRENYEGIANIMDLRFDSIVSIPHRIHLVPREIVVITADTGNPWITDNIRTEDFTTGVVNTSQALRDFRDWAFDNYPTEKPFDAIMSFTGKDLASYDRTTGAFVSELNIGLAFIINDGTLLCQDGPNLMAVSIVEDRSAGDTARTAVHELTHNMGVGHDDDLGCDPGDHFIMASGRQTRQVTARTASNPWAFSFCSEDVIEFTMNGLLDETEGTSCLQEHSFDEEEFGRILNDPFLIQVQSTDEQCRRRVQEESETCIIPSLGRSQDDICFEGILCTLPGTNSCRGLDVEIGTPCGDSTADKFCFRGQCIDQPTTTTTSTSTTTTSTTTTPTTTTTTATTTTTTATTTTTTPTTTTTTPTTTTTTPTTTTTTPTTTTTTPTTTTTTPTTTTTTPTTTTTTPTTTTTTPTTTTTTPTTTTTTPTTTTTTPTTTTTTPTTTTTTPTTTTTTPTTTTTTPTTTTTTPTTTTTTPTTTTTTPTTTTTTPTSTTTTPTTTTTTPTTTTTTPTTTTTTPTTTTTTPTTTTTTPTTTTTTSTTTTTTPTTTTTTPTTTTTTTTTPTTTTTTPTTTTTTPTTTTTTPTTTTTTPTTTTSTTTTTTTTPSTTSTTTTPTTTTTAPTVCGSNLCFLILLFYDNFGFQYAFGQYNVASCAACFS